MELNYILLFVGGMLIGFCGGWVLCEVNSILRTIKYLSRAALKWEGEKPDAK